MPLPRPAVKVATGGQNSCALLDDHSVSCWGSNGFGQLGANVTGHGPATIAGIVDATDVAIGQQTICVTRTAGTVWCWGWQQFLASGGAIPTPPPTQIAGISGTTQLVVNGTMFCAIGANGTVTCWGDSSPMQGVGRDANGNYQLGAFDGASPDRSAVQLAISLLGVCVVDAAHNVTCARRDNIGLNPLVAMPQLANSVRVAVGNGSMCGIKPSGTVDCVDLDPATGLPNGTTRVSTKDPFGSGAAVTDLVGGDYHLCERTTASGSVRCWGDNWAGAVGTLAKPQGGSSGSYVPIPEPLFVGSVGTAGSSTVCGYQRQCL